MWRPRARRLRIERVPSELRSTLEELAKLLFAIGIALLLYATLKGQLARAAEFPKDVGAGTLLFQAADGGFDASAPLTTDIRISVAGVVARVAIAQRFRNTGTSWAEAVYALPLPDDAAVDTLKMTVGDRVIEGEIHERAQAEKIYGEARAAGQHASLVRQTSANLFTTAVANIGPGEAIDITIEYLQTARYDAGEFSLRLPLTLTPRYGAGDTPEAQAAAASVPLPKPATTSGPIVGVSGGFRQRRRQDVAAAAYRDVFTAVPKAPTRTDDRLRDALHEDASPEASIHAVVAAGMPLKEIGGQGHELRATRRKGADVYELETVSPRVPMDRDLLIAWRPLVGSSPAVAALTETRGDTTYALLMILPPDTAHVGRAQPREQIYVIDTSGSMAGQSLEQAQAALKDALGRLTSADRFNVLQFNSFTTALYRTPVPFTTDTYNQALGFVQRLSATGGTEIAGAIRAALAQPVTPEYLRQVVFVTDGAVGAETTLYDTIKQNLGDARLFTVGIGSAPNSLFMRKAAQFGRGTYTHIGGTGEVAEKMQALFAKLERVALADVLVDWPVATELYPSQVPDLYAGEPLVLAASFPARPDDPILATAFGTAGGVPWRQTVGGVPTELPGIATLWARRKIEALVDSRVDGHDESLIRKLILDTALEFHLVSPYTSLVAVDKTPARSASAALERKQIANSPPAGARWQTALPRTATPAPLYRWLGALVLLLALVVAFVDRRRPTA
jgi:Ca-activated chloride channel homolog